MFENPDIFTVALGAIIITTLMVFAMSYLTLKGMNQDVHSPNSKADLEDDSLPSRSGDEESSPVSDSPDSRA